MLAISRTTPRAAPVSNVIRGVLRLMSVLRSLEPGELNVAPAGFTCHGCRAPGLPSAGSAWGQYGHYFPPARYSAVT